MTDEVAYVRTRLPEPRPERPLPAYSGVTVWESHPLRLVTGETSVTERSIPFAHFAVGIGDWGLDWGLAVVDRHVQTMQARKPSAGARRCRTCRARQERGRLSG